MDSRLRGQQAHLSSGPLGFAEGSSTASLFLRSAPHRLMLKLKRQYFGYLMQRPDSLENTLMLGKIEGRSFYFLLFCCGGAPRRKREAVELPSAKPRGPKQR